ncbi:MAG: aldo/keto reductase [Verrucomicrobia bacterium]|jgi:aryl-alcohol dehydrogenase-like predicted oxidoreductase|nr:aldo/keto reductase [Verrucomicrobiota bacterium]
MKRQPLGKTGAQVSVLGIGDVADRSVPLEKCVATIHRAMDYGLNLVDTAPNYEAGYSEQIVGAALKGRRDGMFVIDKIDEVATPVGPQVDASLRALGIEMVDLFAFHAVSSLADWETIAAVRMAELAQCQAAGKVRFRGISSHDPDVLHAALASGLCDVVMFPVGPFVNRRYVEEILPLARAKGVGTVCFKTFGAGKLLGDTTGYNQPLEFRPRGKFSSGGKALSTESQLPRLEVAECLHYTLTLNPDVALLGLSFANEQDAAFHAFKTFRPLEDGKLKEIETRALEAIAGKGNCWWNPPEKP